MIRRAIALGLCVAFASPSLSFGDPITRDKAVQIAKREMSKRGISIRVRPHISVERQLTKDIGREPTYYSYVVIFSGAGHTPYGVCIDERSGTVEWCESMQVYEIPVRD